MRINHDLYFSPNFKFTDLDWNNANNLVTAFHDRVYGFYLKPTSLLLEGGHAFAAGVLLVTTIDFLAKIQTGGKTGSRFEQWLITNIPQFDISDPDNSTRTLAKRFYDEFRNGLVHEGRIKNGGQFSFEIDNLHIVSDNSVMIINPRYLFQSVSDSFKKYETDLSDEFVFQKFRCSLIESFQKDMEIVKSQYKQ